MWPRSIGGGTERRSRFGQQTNQAVTDENSVVFWTAQQQAFEWLRDAVEHAMRAVTIGPAPSAVAAPDPVAQIRQLADPHPCRRTHRPRVRTGQPVAAQTPTLAEVGHGTHPAAAAAGVEPFVVRNGVDGWVWSASGDLRRGCCCW
jgi:hypothetical protein